MANGFSTEVFVKRRARDGWHVYTCDEIAGLFVASEDDQVAYNDVPKAIRTLMRLDHGIDCVVTHKISYAEFMAQVRLQSRADDALAERTSDLMEGGLSRIPFALYRTVDDHHSA